MARLSTFLASLVVFSASASASLLPLPISLPPIFGLGGSSSSSSSKNPFTASQIRRFVLFGDSYSVQNVGDGRVQWADWLASPDYANLQLFDFAQSGATCSQAITPRIFPAIMEDELPLYETMQKNGTLPKLDPRETLFSAWIGTNGVGAGCLLTGDQTQGVTLVDTTNCVVRLVQDLYKLGGRNFLFLNVRGLLLFLVPFR